MKRDLAFGNGRIKFWEDNILVSDISSEFLNLVCVICPFCDGTKIAKRNVGEMIALMHSELSEALEGRRKELKDDKLPQWDMVDVEMVDCMIRILDFLGQKGVNVERIFKEKMEFNRVRKDHKLEERLKEGGKKF